MQQLENQDPSDAYLMHDSHNISQTNVAFNRSR